MTSVPDIVDLKSLVEPYLNGAELQSYDSRYLTKPGDNYGSCMLAIAANIKRTNGQVEELPIIAKLPPLTNEIYWQIFSPERTCITENTVFHSLAPEMRQLQLEAGLPKEKIFDGIPRYYGSRIALDPKATKVDRDAVLVQENLQISGYKPGNRHKMFDFAHAQLVLEYLAQFHALSIALRHKKPENFSKSIRPYFNRFNMNNTLGPEMLEDVRKSLRGDLEIVTNKNAKEVEEIMKLFDLFDEMMAQPEAADGPFTTVSHFDLWINNIMFKYDEKNQPQKLKFVDFQIAQFESLAHDIIFFMLFCLEVAVLENDFENLLKIYYKAFIQCLEEIFKRNTACGTRRNVTSAIYDKSHIDRQQLASR
ncbi:uncharacterized protein [Eurosta solidaginis]|uniref:uncharacterized protein isoform X2 n=1 Tax=Eurosta solidaginis TaxID=178769 RepID=UPI0035313B11